MLPFEFYKTPHLKLFQFLKTSILQFFRNDQLLSLKFGQISVQKAVSWTKQSALEDPKVGGSPPSPYFQPFGLHTHTKMKVEYPLGLNTLLLKLIVSLIH